MQTNHQLIQSMIASGVLKTPQIINAFETVDRKNFIPIFYRLNTYVDAPLPIGNGQTISQPSTVAFMLEHLQPQAGDDILDIGSGSGWTTSLLCHIVGENGSVTGLERVHTLVETGQEHLAQFDFKHNCTIQEAGEQLGIPNKTFDRILVSASAEYLPEELFDQLKIGGTLVIPILNSIFKFTKDAEGTIESKEYRGFRFVPLIF